MKTHQTIVAALMLAAGVTLAACASPEATTSPSSSSPASASASAQQSSNEADVMFATMMIPHHEQAVEMSDLVLAKEGVDQRVTDLAEAVKAAQQPEIDTLQDWLVAWGADTSAGSVDHAGHGDGMMTDDDLTALQSADGATASKLYLEQMIVHHEGAVDMAQTQVRDGSNADATALAEDIITAQNAEIQQMRDILASL